MSKAAKTLVKIRRIAATGGAHVRWVGKAGKWIGNSTAGAGKTDAELIAAFEAAGWNVSEVVVETGRYVVCPRCSGTGHYGGGYCYRCYGSASTGWKAE